MNKRIRKKQRKLKSRQIGDNTYTYNDIRIIQDSYISRYILFPIFFGKGYKLTRPKIRRLINYIRKKHRTYPCQIKKEYMLTDQPKMVPGGERILYPASMFIDSYKWLEREE